MQMSNLALINLKGCLGLEDSLFHLTLPNLQFLNISDMNLGDQTCYISNRNFPKLKEIFAINTNLTHLDMFIQL
jgi:hypothetical protein